MFKSSRLAVFVAGFVLAAAASAQQPPQGYDEGYADPSAGAPDSADAVDPPSRVARLSLINGAVSFVPAGENDWVEAQINRPLVTGDKLWTDDGARAELQIGPAAIRVDQQTSFSFLNLDDQTAQVEVTQGTLNLRVRRVYEGQSYEIDTPTLAFVINRVGEYRVDIAPDGNGTIVTVFHGSGDAYGEGGARFRVEEGQSVRFNDAQLRDYASNNLPQPDDFDRFAFSRDSRWDSSPSRQYVSEDVIGYEDLDSNGSWNDEPEYGNVWYPTSVAASWTPYSDGAWGWVGSYGWTWVDASPWGFAPFHYGRWAYIHNRWGWCPGPVHIRPYYAPALVAFIGGGGVRVGFSSGAPVGWFPLGPRDVYVPGYRVSRDYFTRVNINNTTINSVTINNYYGNYARGNFDYSHVNYANRNIAGAVTAVPGNVFVGARPVHGSVLPVTRETFANARVSGFAAIAPTRQSLGFGSARMMPAPRIAPNRNVIAATRPPAPIAPFAQRQSLLQRDPGRALPTRELRDVSVQNGAQTLRGEHGNVNVVTSNGRPARIPAQAIVPRGPAQQQPERATTAAGQAQNVDRRGPVNNVQQDRRVRNNNERTPRDTVDSAAQQQYRSAPVERGAQPDFQQHQQPQQQQAQERARQQQFDQQRQQQAQERAAQQQQPVQQRQQEQERATRQQQFDPQRQQQAQERSAQQQAQQQAQERAVQQQQLQQRQMQERAAQQQKQQPQPQQQQNDDGRHERKPRDDNKDDRGHR